MAMTRKDYRATAEVLKQALDNNADETGEVVAEIAQGLAYMFKCDNRSFRFDTFYEACGFDENGRVAVR